MHVPTGFTRTQPALTAEAWCKWGLQACYGAFFRITAACRLRRSLTGRPRHFSAPKWRAGQIAGQGQERGLCPPPSPIAPLTQAALGRLRTLPAISRVRFYRPHNGQLFFVFKLPGAGLFHQLHERGTYNAIFSFHPGAGGVAMCDGSARMISENISIVTFVRLMTPHGREPLTDQF